MNNGLPQSNIIKLKALKKELDLANIKGGIKRSDLKSEAQKALFDFFNTNKNGGVNEVLDVEELAAVVQTFTELAFEDDEDNVISNKDTKKFIKNVQKSGKLDLTPAQLQNLENNDVLAFLESLEELSSAILSSEIGGEDVQMATTYKDGSVERIFDDGTSIIKKRLSNGNY